MVIMRRFKTNSASSSASSSRKSSASSVGGLFKSASSPTPPTNFSTSIDNSASTSSAVTSVSTTSTTTTSTSSSSKNNTVLFRYGRAINRSLHYVSGGGSHSHDGDADKADHHDNQSNGSHLKVGDNSGQDAAPKSPLSPKLPSRFKFSKNKSKSSSATTLRSKSGEGQLLDPANVPSTSNAVPFLDSHSSKSSSKSASKTISKSASSSSSRSGRPLLIRQHSDEHHHVLIEKVLQEGKDHGKKDKKEKAAKISKSASSSSKNVGKLRKMAALESITSCHHHQSAADIVYEEGDSNKVLF